MSDIREAEIQSYIDGVADSATRARVEDFIADRPTERARVHETRDDMAQLRRYFTAVDAQIPDHYIAETVGLIVDHAPNRRAFHRAVALRVAAMVTFLVLGSAAVLGIKVSMTVPAFADAAALAYQDVARQTSPGDEDTLSDPERMIEWLNAKTGLMIHVPYIEGHGFNLTDGRLTRFDRSTAGQLVYEDWRHHRVVIFVTRVSDRDDPEPHFAFDRSTYINYWSRNAVGVVIAAADKQDLEEFTRATKQQIDISAVPSAIGAR